MGSFRGMALFGLWQASVLLAVAATALLVRVRDTDARPVTVQIAAPHLDAASAENGSGLGEENATLRGDLARVIDERDRLSRQYLTLALAQLRNSASDDRWRDGMRAEAREGPGVETSDNAATAEDACDDSMTGIGNRLRDAFDVLRNAGLPDSDGSLPTNGLANALGGRLQPLLELLNLLRDPQAIEAMLADPALLDEMGGFLDNLEQLLPSGGGLGGALMGGQAGAGIAANVEEALGVLSQLGDPARLEALAGGGVLQGLLGEPRAQPIPERVRKTVLFMTLFRARQRAFSG